MRCINCNKEINNNSKYCEYCGCKINNSFNVNNNVNNNNVNLNNSNNYMNNNINQNNNQFMNNNVNQNSNIDFKTWDGALNLFKSVKCIGRENCIFLAYKDYFARSRKIFFPKLWNKFPKYSWGYKQHRLSNNLLEIKNKPFYDLGIEYFSALLLNVTENGIYFIPMIQYIGNMIVLSTLTPKYLNPNPNNCIFISKDNIESVKIKYYSFRVKLTITILGGINFILIVNKKEKLVLYQEVNFKKFMNMCYK